MTPNLQRKLEALAERHEEVGRLLADSGVIADNNRFRALSREYSQLEPVVAALAEHHRVIAELDAARAMRNDPEMRELAEAEIPLAEARLVELDAELGLLLIPRDPRDEGNVFLEVRAGTGGDEAAIFAGDLFRMYARYAERQRWTVEVQSSSPGEHGGFKEIVARIEGRGAYSRLKFESGTHRVQRVPARFEAQRAVGAGTFDAQHDLLVAADLGRAFAQHLGAPALAFAPAQVHARQVAGEECRLVTARTGPDLDEGMAIVLRVPGQQLSLELHLQCL